MGTAALTKDTFGKTDTEESGIKPVTDEAGQRLTSALAALTQ